MADVEILPDWAAHYVQEELSEHMHIINVLPIDKGALRGAFLLNTSKGAVLVQKGRVGEVSHWFMPLPGEHFTFRCDECSETMEFVDPDVPRIVYCSSCGERYYLVIQDGRLAMVREQDSDAAGTPSEASGAEGYVHEGYTLYRRRHGQGEQYFFSKTKPRTGQPAPLPEGRRVETNPRTGVPNLVPETPQKAAAYYAYRGDIHPVIDVEGIGERHAKRLERAGVKTTARLMYEDAEQLAARIEAPAKVVRGWQAMAELMLVNGIGKQYAEALARSGVKGIQGLKDGDAKQLAKQVNAYLEGLDSNVLGQKVTARRVQAWQKAAADMRRVRTKVPAS